MPHDLLLNMNYDLNQFLGYLFDNYEGNVVVEKYQALINLKNRPRINGMLKSTRLSDEESLVMLDVCEFLSKKSKKKQFVYPYDELHTYEICQCIFAKKNPDYLETLEAMRIYKNYQQTIQTIGYTKAPKAYAQHYNYLCYYWKKNGHFMARPLCEFLDIMFNCKIKKSIALLLEIA